MSNTLGVPTGPGAGPAPVPNSNDLSANITAATNAAPELASQPSTAVTIAGTGGDVALKAQVVAQAGNRQAIADAHTSLFGDITGGASKILSGVAHAANVGLSTVQQEYRYLHDVEAKHGLTTAMLLGAGIVAGATAGGLVAGPEGVLLGAEGVARLEGAAKYQDSWRAAANPNYRDPHTGQLVSFGRDMVSAAAAHGVIGGGGHGAYSGVLDGLFDLVADPLALGGKGFKAAQEGTIGGLAGKRFTGLNMVTPEMVDHARMVYPSYQRALTQIADMGPTKIAQRFPQFQEIAETLGNAHTADKVHEVFHDLAKSSQLLDSQRLPTMSITRTATGALHDAARNAGDGPIANNALFGPARWSKRLERMPGATYDPEKMDFSSTSIPLANTRGLRDIYAWASFGNSDRVAQAVGDAFTNGTVAQRKVILKNLMFDTVFNVAKMKLPASDEYVQMLKGASSQDTIQHALDFRATEDPAHYLSEMGKGDVTAHIKKMFENHLDAGNFEGVNPEREYGLDEFGRSIEGPVQANGVTQQAGILRAQTGNVTLPNLVEVRRMAAAIRSSRVHRTLAGMDDFFYNHVTQAFFKPLVLMSVGYAWHISLAEAIPNALRNGLTDTTQTMYRRAIANLGYKQAISPDELKGLTGYLWKMGGEKAYSNSEEAQTLANWWLMHDGNRRPVGMATGEITSGETQPSKRAEAGLFQQQAVPTRESGRWSKFGQEDERFPELHQRWLRQVANDKWSQTAAHSYLNAIQDGESRIAATEEARQSVVRELQLEPKNVIDDHVRSTGKRAGAPETWTPMDDWAQSIVENMKGAVHGRPTGLDDLKNPIAGAPNIDLLRSVANRHTPEIEDLKALPVENRPLYVPGQVLVPAAKTKVQAIANWGFHNVMDPMVNMISRNQEFASRLIYERKLLDVKVNTKIMSEDQAMNDAASAATVHSMRFIHNLNDRTQWTVTMRNWAPFFFAQEQAYRRMGRLLVEDPGAFRQYQLMISGAANSTATMQDGQGNQYIALPGTGWAGKGLAEAMGLHGLAAGSVMPAAYGGSSSSANVIFPLSQGFRPGLGPVAMVPLNLAGSMFSELGKSYPQYRKVSQVAINDLAWVQGPQALSSTPLWEQLIPNAFVAHTVDAFANGRAFQSSIIQAYQLAEYQQAQAVDTWVKNGRSGPMPQIVPSPQDLQNNTAAAQAFKNKITNWTRSLYIGRAVTAMFSPISANVEIQNFGFHQDLNKEIQKAGSVNIGMQNFLLHHPDAGSYTVSESFAPTGSGSVSGISLPSSKAGEDWIVNNRESILKYGQSFYWLMPQLTNQKYDPAIYNEQIAQGDRVKYTPQQFLNQLYVSAGDQTYYASLAVHESNILAAGTSRQAKNAEYDTWKSYVATLQQQNPVWAEEFFNNSRQLNAKNAITGLHQIFADNAAPSDPQSAKVKYLLSQYDQAAATYQAAGNSPNYLHAQAQVYDGWVQYLKSVEQADPALKPIVTSVFKQALKPVT